MKRCNKGESNDKVWKGSERTVLIEILISVLFVKLRKQLLVGSFVRGSKKRKRALRWCFVQAGCRQQCKDVSRRTWHFPLCIQAQGESQWSAEQAVTGMRYWTKLWVTRVQGHTLQTLLLKYSLEHFGKIPLPTSLAQSRVWAFSAWAEWINKNFGIRW